MSSFIDNLIRKKTIRDFLSLFTQNKWESIISICVEFGIANLKINYNIASLSLDDLYDILEKYNDQITDKDRKNKAQLNNKTITKQLSNIEKNQSRQSSVSSKIKFTSINKPSSKWRQTSNDSDDEINSIKTEEKIVKHATKQSNNQQGLNNIDNIKKIINTMNKKVSASLEKTVKNKSKSEIIDMTNIFKIGNTSSNQNTYDDTNYQVKKPVLSSKTKIDNKKKMAIDREIYERLNKLNNHIDICNNNTIITTPIKSEHSIRQQNTSSVKGNNNVFNSRNNFGPSKVFNYHNISNISNLNTNMIDENSVYKDKHYKPSPIHFNTDEFSTLSNYNNYKTKNDSIDGYSRVNNNINIYSKINDLEQDEDNALSKKRNNTIDNIDLEISNNSRNLGSPYFI